MSVMGEFRSDLGLFKVSHLLLCISRPCGHVICLEVFNHFCLDS
uniref:Uncharacterized protein n=1 Tax=Rhizophora mucronata TaxID=61149 RepID=A0A2P2LW46_RHIMU